MITPNHKIAPNHKITLNHNTEPKLPQDITKNICSIGRKKKNIIHTTVHIEKILDNLCDTLSSCCGIKHVTDSKYKVSNEKNYVIYVTSGNDESNQNIIFATITSFKRITKKTPHIIFCHTTDVSLIKYMQQLELNGNIRLDMVPTNIYGNTITQTIERLIVTGETCMVIIASGNHLFNTTNLVKKIGEMTKTHNIPLHVDATYMFGKTRIEPLENNMDSFVFDFANVGGAKCGIAGIRNDFLEGYQLNKIIDTAPNIKKIDPINVELAIHMTKYAYKNRKGKDKKVAVFYRHLRDELAGGYLLINLVDYVKNNYDSAKKKNIILLSMNESNGMCMALETVCPDNLKKIQESVLTDPLDEYVINIYKNTFRSAFDTSKKNIDIFNNMLLLSWDDSTPQSTITLFVSKLKKLY